MIFVSAWLYCRGSKRRSAGVVRGGGPWFAARQSALGWSGSDLDRVAHGHGIGGHVPIYERAGLDQAVIADGDAGQHDRARSQIASLADAGVKVQVSCEIMSQHHRLFGDVGVGSDMDPVGPRPVDQCGRLDPGRGVDIHAPEMPPHQPLKHVDQSTAVGDFHRGRRNAELEEIEMFGTICWESSDLKLMSYSA